MGARGSHYLLRLIVREWAASGGGGAAGFDVLAVGWDDASDRGVEVLDVSPLLVAFFFFVMATAM